MDIEISANPGTNHEAPPTDVASPFTDNNAVIINILPREDLTHCHFWLGVFQEGSLHPVSLLDYQDTTSIFLRAATEGLAEDKPLMLSDCATELPRFFYFVPTPKSLESLNTWIDTVSRTIIDLKLEQLGIYLAPELLVKERAQSLLSDLLEKLIQKSCIKQYHLYPGGHGSNQILNTALQLKNSIENQAAKIFVFH